MSNETYIMLLEYLDLLEDLLETMASNLIYNS